MGDSGSLALGYLLAVVLTKLAVFGLVPFLCGLIIAAVPILDMLIIMVRRFLQNKPIFAPDRGHFYDRIDDAIRNKSVTVAITYAVTIALGLIGIATSFAGLATSVVVVALVAIVFTVTTASFGWLRFPQRS